MTKETVQPGMELWLAPALLGLILVFYGGLMPPYPLKFWLNLIGILLAIVFMNIYGWKKMTRYDGVETFTEFMKKMKWANISLIIVSIVYFWLVF